jgi:hypothetical protein
MLTSVEYLVASRTSLVSEFDLTLKLNQTQQPFWQLVPSRILFKRLPLWQKLSLAYSRLF